PFPQVPARSEPEGASGELQHRARPARVLLFGPEVGDDQSTSEFGQGRGEAGPTLLALQIDRLAEDHRGERSASKEDRGDAPSVGAKRGVLEVVGAPPPRVELRQNLGREERRPAPDEPSKPGAPPERK